MRKPRTIILSLICLPFLINLCLSNNQPSSSSSTSSSQISLKNKFRIGFGYPYLALRYGLSPKIGLEARTAFDLEVSMIGMRCYYNFIQISEIIFYVGIEYDSVTFACEDISGTGIFSSIFIGGERFFSERLSLSADLGGGYTGLKDSDFSDISVSDIDLIIDLTVSYYFKSVVEKKQEIPPMITQTEDMKPEKEVKDEIIEPEKPEEVVVSEASILDKDVLDQIEDDLIPTFIYIKKGLYLDATKELSSLLKENKENRTWNRIENKLDKIVGITAKITKKDKVSRVMRDGLQSFLKPIEDPKDALIKVYYAGEIEKNKQHQDMIKKMYIMLQNYYPDIAKDEDVPEGFTLVSYKLYKALKSIQDGYYDIAIEQSKEVLELEPNNILALKRLGSALYALGKEQNNPKTVEKGREIWNKALDLSPDDEELKRFLEEKK